jgi:hypothetical protein
MDYRPIGGRDSGPGGLGIPNAIAALSNAFAADGNVMKFDYFIPELFADDLSSAVFSEVIQEEANMYFQKVTTSVIKMILILLFSDLRLSKPSLGSRLLEEDEDLFDLSKSTGKGIAVVSVEELVR